MATFTKVLLSGSTNGKAIKVVATASTGTTIHTCPSGTSSLDEIWLYAINTQSLAVLLTLEWGQTTAPDGNIIITIPAQAGLMLVAPGLLLQNSLVVTAFASVANVVELHGYVNRVA
jgi:hypothetical protein